MSNSASHPRSGGRILIDQLLLQGVKHIFCVPGESFLAALERFASPPEDQAMPVMLGVIGAAEALAREASAGRLSRLEAVTALKRIIVGAARGE